MAGLYLHIPFCRSKCAYCDFYSVAAKALDADRYVNAVATELLSRRKDYAGEFDTVYIGGGTPSVLPSETLARLIRMLRNEARSDAEVTVEVNPDDITPGFAEAIARAGANRVSMGVQSLVDTELSAISRRHDSGTALSAINTLRSAGIGNISCDLIYGLPGQTPESFEVSINRLLQQHPEHISAYLLSYEPGTKLTHELEAGHISETSDTEAETYYHRLCKALADAGYIHYEISNFCLPGRHSRHNSSYWNPASPYLGLGPSAHSYDGNSVRRANIASIGRYLANPADAADPSLSETLTPEQIFDERLMLGLRTMHGVNLDDLDRSAVPALLSRAAPWIESGHLKLDESLLTIPEHSWLIADAIMADLFAD